MSVIAQMQRTKTDSVGYKPDLDLIGTQYVHVKGDMYTISGFAFDAERDMWQIEYHRTEAPADDQSLRFQKFTRTPANFFGKHDNGETRFRRVNPGAPKKVFRGGPSSAE